LRGGLDRRRPLCSPPPPTHAHAPTRPGVICGAAASGNYHWNDPNDIGKLLACTMMSGPFLTGYTQVRPPLRFAALFCARRRVCCSF